MSEARAQERMRLISIERRPITGMLMPIPIVCFLGNLLTDLAYLNSGGNLTWLNFSTWLNAAGLVFGFIAAIALFIDTVRTPGSWIAFAILAAAWVIELINAFVHARDGWTAVAGPGLVLSILGATLALIAGWLWQGLRYRVSGDRP